MNKSVKAQRFASFFYIANPFSCCLKSRLIKMSRVWKTYCVLLLCVSTLKVLAADSTSSQKDRDEKHNNTKTREEAEEEVKDIMG